MIQLHLNIFNIRLIFGIIIIVMWISDTALDQYKESKKKIYYSKCIDTLGVTIESIKLNMSIGFEDRKISGDWVSKNSNEGSLRGEIVSDKFQIVLIDTSGNYYLTLDGIYNKGYFLGSWIKGNSKGNFEAYY